MAIFLSNAILSNSFYTFVTDTKKKKKVQHVTTYDIK